MSLFPCLPSQQQQQKSNTAATNSVVLSQLLLTNWFASNDEGCPVNHCAPGVLTACGGSTVREPVGNIHFATTEAATSWNGILIVVYIYIYIY